MNALRLMIAVFWLALSATGSYAMAMPFETDAKAMPCHEAPAAPATPALPDLMPCCAHTTVAPLALPEGTMRLYTDPISHPIVVQFPPLGLAPQMEPEPPRRV